MLILNSSGSYLANDWVEFNIGYFNQGSSRFKIWLVTGYRWLPDFQNKGGYRLPLVTIIAFSDQLPLVTKFDDLDQLRSVTTLLLVTIGYLPNVHPTAIGTIGYQR